MNVSKMIAAKTVQESIQTLQENIDYMKKYVELGKWQEVAEECLMMATFARAFRGSIMEKINDTL